MSDTMIYKSCPICKINHLVDNPEPNTVYLCGPCSKKVIAENTHKSEDKGELATRTWQEKLPSGEIVDVVEVIDDYLQLSDCEIASFISKANHSRAIFVINFVDIATLGALYEKGYVAVSPKDKVFDDWIFPTLQEALERMARL